MSSTARRKKLSGFGAEACNVCCWHSYGDGVLVEISLLLNHWARRPGDFAARIGGEEFALFLYDCPLDAASTRINDFFKGGAHLAT